MQELLQQARVSYTSTGTRMAAKLQGTTSVYCPNEITVSSSQKFLNLPEGFSLRTFRITSRECQGTYMLCEYANSIVIQKDYSSQFSGCVEDANNPYGCSCI